MSFSQGTSTYKESPDIARRNVVILCFLMSIFLLGGNIEAIGPTIKFNMIFAGFEVKTEVFLGAVLCMYAWFIYRYRLSLRHNKILPVLDWHNELHKYLSENEELRALAFSKIKEAITADHEVTLIGNPSFIINYKIVITNYKTVDVYSQVRDPDRQTDVNNQHRNNTFFTDNEIKKHKIRGRVSTILNDPTFTEWIVPYLFAALQPLLLLYVLITTESLISADWREWFVNGYSAIGLTLLCAYIISDESPEK